MFTDILQFLKSMFFKYIYVFNYICYKCIIALIFSILFQFKSTFIEIQGEVIMWDFPTKLILNS